MASGRFAILDPAAGMSGDMLLGALIDVGAPSEWLAALPGRLGFQDVTVAIERVSRCGVSCTKVTLRLPGGATENPSPRYVLPHRHDGAGQTHHGHRHDPGSGTGNHRHYAELVGIIERAPLSGWVRERATRAFRLLCEEEGRVHGTPAEAVALHEVGAVDAVVDIVGGLEGFERLGIEQVHIRPVALGSGWVETAHGVMAAPTPVTTRILEGIEIGPDGPVIGEATTPTGAVLLRVLSSGTPPSRWRPVSTGWGAGGRDPEHYSNALRLVLAEPATEAGHVVTLSSDLDDLSPEYVEPLREELVAAGALDVQVWGTLMKKGRLGIRIEAICLPAEVDRVTEALFLHSTTTGVRRSVAERVTLPRRVIEVPASDGQPVHVKVVETPAGPRVKAEFDDVRQAAIRLRRPAHELAREIETQARALVTGTAASGSRPPKELG
jgi:uncharacterized protein (TIGR00299 family) protein